MNITVYLGASSGNDPTLETSVRALGRLIGVGECVIAALIFSHN